jgi:tetratricopeptide (TPR) repeat protein
VLTGIFRLGPRRSLCGLCREEIRQGHEAADGELIDPAGPYDLMSYFDAVVRMNSKSAAAYAMRAQVYERFGNFDKALIGCNKAIELEATSVHRLNQLAWLLAT